jgi:hypothetical protein
MSLTVTKVPRALENRLRLFGFELADLLIVFLYLSISNLIFGATKLKLPLVWGGTLVIGTILFFAKRGKPEGYLQHLIQFRIGPSTYSAGTFDTQYRPAKIQSGDQHEQN